MKVGKVHIPVLTFILIQLAIEPSQAGGSPSSFSSDRTKLLESLPESSQNTNLFDEPILTNNNEEETQKDKGLDRKKPQNSLFLRGLSKQTRHKLVDTTVDRSNQVLSKTIDSSNNGHDNGKNRLLQDVTPPQRQLEEPTVSIDQTEQQQQQLTQPDQNETQQPNIQPDQQQQDQSEEQQEQTNFDNPVHDEGKTTVPPFVLFLAAIFASYMIRKKMIENNWSNNNSNSSYQYHGLTRGVVGSSINGTGNGGSNSSVHSFGSDYDDNYDDDNFTYGLSVTGNDNNTSQKKKSSFGFRNSSSSSRKNARVQEMVPLSTTSNEDEWGWEDSNANRDLEMAVKKAGTNSNTKASAKQKVDLQMALGSLSLDKSRQQHKVNNGVTSDDDITPTTSNNVIHTAASKDSWDQDSANWEDHEATSSQTSTTNPTEPPVITTSASPLTQAPKNSSNSTPDSIEEIMKQNFAGSTITSLSKPKPAASASSSSAASAKKKKEKIEEEDIFASMGLSTVPSTRNSTSLSASKTPKAVLSMNEKSSSTSSTSKLNDPSSLSAAVLSPTEDSGSLNGGDKWDDDSDLDDLLED